MLRALALARRGMGSVSPNPMVGAVLVKEGGIIGESWHKKCGEGHAEVNAIADARLRGNDPAGSTIYVTLEPCSSYGRTPPCTEGILKAGISRVVVGCADPNPKHAGRGIAILREKGVEVTAFVLEGKCRLLNESFFYWITTGKPFVLLKLAQTLDGKIATKGGSSQWITSGIARKHVMRLRLWADGVMAGGETFRKDAPQFTVRNGKGEVLKTPRRFIVTRNPGSFQVPEGENWEFIDLSSPNAWEEFLLRLGRENVTGLLLEGGGELAASALQAGAVNKVEFHIAPKILGGRASRPSVGGEDPERIDEGVLLENMQMRALGKDFLLSGYPVRKK